MWNLDDMEFDESYPTMEAFADDNETIGLLEDLLDLFD